MTPPEFNTSSLESLHRSLRLMMLFLKSLLFMERKFGWLPDWIDACLEGMDRKMCRLEDYLFKFAEPSADLDRLRKLRTERDDEQTGSVGRAECNDARQSNLPAVETSHPASADFGLRPLSALHTDHDAESNHFPHATPGVTPGARLRASGGPSLNSATRAERQYTRARAPRTRAPNALPPYTDQLHKIIPRARPPPAPPQATTQTPKFAASAVARIGATLQHKLEPRP